MDEETAGVKLASGVKVNAYAVISRAVEEGLRYGWRRAHKHTETPEEEAIFDQQEQGVMNALCEVLDFD